MSEISIPAAVHDGLPFPRRHLAVGVLLLA